MSVNLCWWAWNWCVWA